MAWADDEGEYQPIADVFDSAGGRPASQPGGGASGEVDLTCLAAYLGELKRSATSDSLILSA